VHLLLGTPASHRKRWRDGAAIDWVPRGRPTAASAQGSVCHGRLNVQSGHRDASVGQPPGYSGAVFRSEEVAYNTRVVAAALA